MNTIPLDEQPPFPGDLGLEQRLAALMRWNALAMVMRANRAESVKMIMDKFKVNQQEADGTYATLIKILNKDGRMNLKVARGYLDILRQERPIAADYDPMKHTDFSLLPRS